MNEQELALQRDLVKAALDSERTIPFTEFRRPHGSHTDVNVAIISVTAYNKAKRMLEKFPNTRFEFEVLSAGHGSFTFTHDDVGDLAMLLINSDNRYEGPTRVANWIENLDETAIRKQLDEGTL